MDTVSLDCLKHEIKTRIGEQSQEGIDAAIDMLLMMTKHKYGDRIQAIAATQYVNFVSESIKRSLKLQDEMAEKYPMSCNEEMFERA